MLTEYHNKYQISSTKSEKFKSAFACVHSYCYPIYSAIIQINWAESAENSKTETESDPQANQIVKQLKKRGRKKIIKIEINWLHNM
jgi:hypothetical protein